jgi:hypothetical protein
MTAHRTSASATRPAPLRLCVYLVTVGSKVISGYPLKRCSDGSIAVNASPLLLARYGKRKVCKNSLAAGIAACDRKAGRIERSLTHL